MLEIDDKTYILGYWYVRDSSGNFSTILTIKQNNEWKIQNTLRDKSNNIKNEKIFFKSSDEPEKNVIEICDNVFEAMKELFDDYSDKFLVQGDLYKFIDLAKDKSYFDISEHKIQ